jgi:hypothetical protein
MAWAPAAIALGSALLSYMENRSGKNDAKMGSTYSDTQQSFIDRILSDVQGMRSNQNITQNPQYQQGQEYLNSLFNDPEFFNKFEAPIRRQYEEEIMPNLANRFASMGSGGSTGSTGFRNQALREQTNLSTNLAALRGQLQQQGAGQALQYAQAPFNNLMQMAQLGLTPTNNVYQPPSAGMFGPLAAQAGSGAIQYYTGQSQPNAAQPQSPYQNRFPATAGYDQEFRQRGVPGQSPYTY